MSSEHEYVNKILTFVKPRTKNENLFISPITRDRDE